MDWLDQYLQELDRPGAMMHFPPDKASWNVPVPSRQQMACMQDATVADMVRMRNIQEARQMEIDAGAGGAYDAGSAAREQGPVTPAAPAGFPDVASANQIAVTNVTGTMFGVANNGIGTYTKNGPINPNTNKGAIYYVIDAGGDPSAAITFNSGQWELNYNDDGAQTHSINPSTDPTTIPAIGWSPAITIVAA